MTAGHEPQVGPPGTPATRPRHLADLEPAGHAVPPQANTRAAAPVPPNQSMSPAVPAQPTSSVPPAASGQPWSPEFRGGTPPVLDGAGGGPAPGDLAHAPTRPGPLPPRIEPSWGSQRLTGAAPTTAAPPPGSSPWAAPAVPRTAPLAPTGPVQPGPPPAAAPPGGPGGVAFGPPPVPARSGRGWPGVTALALVLVLLALVGFQMYQINKLGDQLDATNRRNVQSQAADGARLDSLEGRAGELEKQAGSVFNPEAISTTVLPSVFRVQAGQFTGTAFAVGKPAAGGGTNLFTNFHVVEAVWEGGGREVFLERTDQRFPATIVRVDKDNDVAHLKANSKFTGLTTAQTPVKSGQQIVVVGAPLGLEDSVTTGVVSAFRKAEGGSGEVIQFDAPINPGNSGGPVINGSKQVVGIATAKARGAEGIGLAVPIATACGEFKIC